MYKNALIFGYFKGVGEGGLVEYYLVTIEGAPLIALIGEGGRY